MSLSNDQIIRKAARRAGLRAIGPNEMPDPEFETEPPSPREARLEAKLATLAEKADQALEEARKGMIPNTSLSPAAQTLARAVASAKAELTRRGDSDG